MVKAFCCALVIALSVEVKHTRKFSFCFFCILACHYPSKWCATGTRACTHSSIAMLCNDRAVKSPDAIVFCKTMRVFVVKNQHVVQKLMHLYLILIQTSEFRKTFYICGVQLVLTKELSLLF